MAKGDCGEQRALWNGVGGHSWVEAQEVLDGLFRPFEDVLVDAVRASGAGRVLDVGCGASGVTVAVTRALGGGRQCTGIDISEPMIAAARERAHKEGSGACFIVGDAQEHPFEPDSFDMVISRFGVMFFADPVKAFANLHRAVVDRGELRLATWRSAAENDFMTAAQRAAGPLLPNLAVPGLGEAGQFGFADPGRVRKILEESGWTAIGIEPLDVVCRMRSEDLMVYGSTMGPVGRALRDVDDATREQVNRVVREAFDSFVHGDEARFTAACWMVSAKVAR